MRKLIYIFLPLLALLTGCSDPTPADILSMDEMAALMAEMQIAHAGVDLTVEQKDGKLKASQEINVAILDAQGVDRDLFFNSYEYYQQTPSLMDSIYIRVLADLESQVDSMLRLEGQNGVPPIDKSKE